MLCFHPSVIVIIYQVLRISHKYTILTSSYPSPTHVIRRGHGQSHMAYTGRKTHNLKTETHTVAAKPSICILGTSTPAY